MLLLGFSHHRALKHRMKMASSSLLLDVWAAYGDPYVYVVFIMKFFPDTNLSTFEYLSIQDVADIRQQFPSLGGDITFPMFFREEQFFSGVFRISSPGLQLWTHYDVCYKIKNVKVQKAVALTGLILMV